MIYRHTSSAIILKRVYKLFRPGDSDWEHDALEYIGESMQYIGYHKQFESKEVTLKVRNFRAVVPSDLYELRGVEYNGQKIDRCSAINSTDTDKTLNAKPNVNDENVVAKTGDSIITNSSGITIHGFGKTRQGLGSGNCYDFDMSDGVDYIFTSFESGEIKLHYKAFATDGCGYPMIPDNIYFIDAAFWYVVKMLMMMGYTHPTITRKEAEGKWQTKCIQAGNDGMFPDIDKMDSFMGGWLRMIPDVQRPDDMFTGNQNIQHIG